MPILKEAGITAKVVRMDPYKDPDEFIKNLGAEEFEKRIHAARNGFMFSLEMLEKEYDMNSPEGKTAFLQGSVQGDCLNLRMSWSVTTISKRLQQHTGSAVESLEKLVAKMAVNDGMARPVSKTETGSRDLRRSRKEDGILTSQKALVDLDDR